MSLTYKTWTSIDLTHWTEDSAGNTFNTIPGTDNEAVEVTFSPGLLNAERLFARIQAQ